MAKKYTVKDLNKNGKIDGWEQGKYDAINSATKMSKGYSMKMGSKENYSPTNFKTKDAMLMMQSPMRMIGGNIPDVESYELVKNDPLAQESMDQMTNNFHDMYKTAGSSYTNINIGNKTSSSSDSDAYAALGGSLKKLVKPKEGTEGYNRQQERKANRAVERFKRGGVDYNDQKYAEARKKSAEFKNKKGSQTKVGEKLRKIFK